MNTNMNNPSARIYNYLDKLNALSDELDRHLADPALTEDLQRDVKAAVIEPNTLIKEDEVFDWNIPFTVAGRFHDDINHFKSSCETAIGLKLFKDEYKPNLERFTSEVLLSWENMKRIKHIDFWLRDGVIGQASDFQTLTAFLCFSDLRHGDDVYRRLLDEVNRGLLYRSDVAFKTFKLILSNEEPNGPRSFKNYQEYCDTYFPGGGRPVRIMDATTTEARTELVKALDPRPGKDRIPELIRVCEEYATDRH